MRTWTESLAACARPTPSQRRPARPVRAALPRRRCRTSDTASYPKASRTEPTMTNEEQAKAIGKVIAKAWADEAFKARLLADPAVVLAAEGVPMPAGVSLRVIENTATVINLILPAKPTDLTDEDMDRLAGGFCVAQDWKGRACAAPPNNPPDTRVFTV